MDALPSAEKQDPLPERSENNGLGILTDEMSEESYLSLAKSFIEEDDNEQAIETLKKAYKINHHNFEVIYQMAFVYLLQTEYEKAVKYFDLAIELRPNNRDACYYKAIALLRQNKVMKALKCFKLLLNMNPRDHFALYQQGLIYFHKKERKKAIVLMTKAKEMGNPDAEEFLGELKIEN